MPIPECGEYSVNDIFTIYGQYLDALITNNTLYNKPYPIYNNVTDYINDTVNDYKGYLVWDIEKYYKGTLITDLQGQGVDGVGLFVLVEFGSVTTVHPIEFRQEVLIHFDTLLEKDRFGSKQLEEINWFINAHKKLVEDVNFDLGYKRPVLYIQMSNISKGIVNEKYASYYRRTILYVLRYCLCVPKKD